MTDETSREAICREATEGSLAYLLRRQAQLDLRARVALAYWRYREYGYPRDYRLPEESEAAIARILGEPLRRAIVTGCYGATTREPLTPQWTPAPPPRGVRGEPRVKTRQEIGRDCREVLAGSVSTRLSRDRDKYIRERLDALFRIPPPGAAGPGATDRAAVIQGNPLLLTWYEAKRIRLVLGRDYLPIGPGGRVSQAVDSARRILILSQIPPLDLADYALSQIGLVDAEGYQRFPFLDLPRGIWSALDRETRASLLHYVQTLVATTSLVEATPTGHAASTPVRPPVRASAASPGAPVGQSESTASEPSELAART